MKFEIGLFTMLIVVCGAIHMKDDCMAVPGAIDECVQCVPTACHIQMILYPCFE
jgi:hypothetical protein